MIKDYFKVRHNLMTYYKVGKLLYEAGTTYEKILLIIILGN